MSTLALAIAIAIAFVAVGPVAFGASQDVSALARTNVINLKGTSASTDVSLRADVTLPGSCGAETVLKVTGGDASVLLDLTPVGYSPKSRDTPIQIGRLKSSAIDRNFSNRCGQRTIRKGSYRLTVVSTSPAVTVRLDLPGLTGSRQLALRARSNARLAALPSLGPYSAASPSIGSFAGDGRLERQGTIGAVIMVKHATSAPALLLGECDTRGKQALPLFLSHAPGCPLGGGVQTVTGGSSGGISFQISSTIFAVADEYTIGTYYAEVGVVSSAASLAFWIPFS